MHQYCLSYLSLYKNLVLPGLGSFTVEHKPASLQFADKTIDAPSKAIAFVPSNSLYDSGLVRYIASCTGLTIDEITEQFSAFINDMQAQLNSGLVFVLHGIGSLSKQNEVVQFKPLAASGLFFAPLAAQKVIRQNAIHQVRVGEEDKTSAEMHTQLGIVSDTALTEDGLTDDDAPPKEKWLQHALILAAIGISIIALYFFTR
jgi:nucleoid DNA-binding protein